MKTDELPFITPGLVDELIELRATLKPLLDKQAELEGKLKAHPEGKYEGTFGYALVNEITRKVTDWKKIAIDLGATKQRIAKNTKEGKPYVRLNVNVHKKAA